MQIHIQRDGEKYGPYSEEEARQYLREGSLLPNDLAWYEGLENWIALNQLIPKLPVAKQTPPPPSKFAPKSARPKYLSPWVAYGIPLVLVFGFILYIVSLFNGAGGLSGQSAGAGIFAFPSSASDLVGVWQAPDQETFEFMKDGDFYDTYAPPGPGVMQFSKGMGGTYSIADDGHRIKLKIGEQVMAMLEFTLQGNSLTIKGANGVVTTYKRIK